MKKEIMRRAALMMTLLTMATPLASRGELKIYKIKGEVTVKTSGGTRKGEKRQTVAASDVLNIPRNAAVSILDTREKRVYSSLSQGRISVKQLIDQAKSNASNITRTTNDMVLEAVADNARSKSEGFGIAGASIHEANAVIHAPMDLPEGMSYLAYLRGLGDGVYNDEYDVILLRRDINYDDETFNFAVFNTLSKPLYFNIIQQRTDREPELHFLDNPIAAPRTQTVVEEYLYLLPDYPDGYIVVASDRDFTIEDVKNLLNPRYEPEADFYFTLLRK